MQRVVWQNPWVRVWNLLSFLRVSIPCSQHYLQPAVAFISSLVIRCQGCGTWGRKGLEWSSVSLAPCEVTKQNFISALSNWTTLIASVIFFLPCVISPLGVKCLWAKLQSSWMPSQHRVATFFSQASQRSRLHKIINDWMWLAHKWRTQVIRRIWRKRFFFCWVCSPSKTFFFFLLLESSYQKLVHSAHRLGITLGFLVMLIKISYKASRWNTAYLQVTNERVLFDSSSLSLTAMPRCKAFNTSDLLAGTEYCNPYLSLCHSHRYTPFALHASC